jgi:hypothetical protein
MTTARPLSVSATLCEWTANEIRYSLRVLTVHGPGAFIVAVGPWVQIGDVVDIRVSAEPIPPRDIPKWLSMSEASRTAAAEYLLRGAPDEGDA